MKTPLSIYFAGVYFMLMSSISCAQNYRLKDHILFYSSFDGKTSANLAMGDAMIYTAKNYKTVSDAQPGLHDSNVVLAKGEGLLGDALHFKEAKTAAVFYKAFQNVGYSSTSWSGTVSFWLRLDPNNALAPSYCDPICITDVRYNDAALWVDFTDHDPKKFRLGAMGDLDVWNPKNENNEAEWNKRTVVVTQPPFQNKEWTHIAMTFSEVNNTRSEFKLYLNGEFQGVIRDINDPFTWEEENGKIMLGLGYIGFMDELVVFDKSLNLEEVKLIFELEKGIKALFE
ncbi:MAG: LamG-like jellyroll fold domain-containing protein [Bacteroidota bacterium]